jgi:hypothetical protein
MVVNDNVYETYLINGSTRVAQGVSDRLRGVLHRVNCIVSYVYMSVATLTTNGQGIKKIQLY